MLLERKHEKCRITWAKELVERNEYADYWYVAAHYAHPVAIPKQQVEYVRCGFMREPDVQDNAPPQVDETLKSDVKSTTTKKKWRKNMNKVLI